MAETAVLPGILLDVVVAGTLAYVAVGQGGLVVMGILASAAPRLVGVVNIPGITDATFVAGKHTCVADGEDGQRVIDVADPARPSLVGAIDTSDDRTTADQHDACSAATWPSETDRSGAQAGHLSPDLTPSERAPAEIEVWMLGAM